MAREGVGRAGCEAVVHNVQRRTQNMGIYARGRGRGKRGREGAHAESMGVRQQRGPLGRRTSVGAHAYARHWGRWLHGGVLEEGSTGEPLL